MSAFGGKADIALMTGPTGLTDVRFCGRYWGVKRTYLFALHMSAFDPKRTLAVVCLQADLVADAELKIQLLQNYARQWDCSSGLINWATSS